MPAPSNDSVCVAPHGSDANTGGPSDPVATIARALAQNRPVILVAGGTYGERLVLNRAVALYGGLDGAWNPAGPPSIFTAAQGAIISADVTLDGVTVRPAGDAHHGLSVERGAKARITRCDVQAGVAPAERATGLIVWGEARVEGCTVRGGDSPLNTGLIAFGGAAHVEDCTIEGSQLGVNCSVGTFVRNRITAGTYAVYIQGEGVVVRDNALVVTGTGRGLFVVSEQKVIAEGNTLNGKSEHAARTRWAHLPPKSWTYDRASNRDYSEVTITENGLWFHGEADGPSGGPYTGPTQDLDDLLVSPPVQKLPDALLSEIRAFLRAHPPKD